MSRFVSGGLALLALATIQPAIAADLPVKAPAAMAVVSSWTGAYVGLGVGIRSAQTNATVTADQFAGADLLGASCAAAVGFGNCFTSEPLNNTAFRVNPYAGYNWQVAPQWVVGIEADAGFADKSTTLNGAVYPASDLTAGVGGDRFVVKTGWDASVRARAGFLVTPSVLFYGTGGLGWLHVESTSVCGSVFNVGVDCLADLTPTSVTSSHTKMGWVAGGGIEAMLAPNWLLRGEYRYADYGTISSTDTRTGAAGSLVTSYDLAVRTHTVTLGLGYKFGEGGSRAAYAADYAAVSRSAPAQTSWTGLYLGAGLGLRSTEAVATVNKYTIAGIDFLAVCPALAVVGGCVPNQSFNDSSFRANPYVGYNWQIAPQWLVGVEGDVGFANKTTTLTGMMYPISATGVASDSFAVKTGWDAGIRARVGYLITPSLLAYATGGAAWQHVEATSTCDAVAGYCSTLVGYQPAIVTNAATKLGWTIGGGLEAALGGNWLARAEYRYADFGTISNSIVRTSPGPASPVIVDYDLSLKSHSATFGVAYKFN